MEQELLLEAEHITYEYEDGTRALEDVNLQINKGEKLVVMGANGSGKSTLFLNLLGILKPKSGKIKYRGNDIDYSRKGLLRLRSRVGMVFQEPDNQLFSASVYQEISFGPMNLGWGIPRVEQAVEAAMEDLEITPFKEKATHFLSGGQKKQVSIADVTAMSPEIIIMDEPTAALDPKHSRMVNRMIEKLCEEGITVVIATHDGDYAFEWADRIILFQEGHVEAAGTPEEIFSDAVLLERTNQEEPKVLRIYRTLIQAGILEETQEVPRSIEELQLYIEESYHSERGK